MMKILKTLLNVGFVMFLLMVMIIVISWKYRGSAHRDCNISLDTLIINSGITDFKYLSQEFDSKVLDVAK